MSTAVEATLTSIRNIAVTIANVEAFSVSDATTLSFQEPPHFSGPEPLTSSLTILGIPGHVAERISDVYIRRAEELKSASENILNTQFSELARFPRRDDSVQFNTLRQRLFEIYNSRYRSTLTKWADEVKEMARTRLSAMSVQSSESHTGSMKKSFRNTRRQFRYEYLPLFEFAYEKDRFPSREDKKQLAMISGMSYHQVSVWFQNRRCRHASRTKSRDFIGGSQSFDEVKKFSASTRVALSRAPSALRATTTVFFPDEPVLSASAVETFNPPPMREVTQHTKIFQPKEWVSPLLGHGLSESSSDSEGHDELKAYDPQDKPIHLASMKVRQYEHSPSPKNPLNRQTPVSSIFPIVYKPSKITFDPFIVDHTPWLRSTQGTETRHHIEPTPEVLADITSGFDAMDVDSPATGRNESTTACKESVESMNFFLPRRRTVACRTASSRSSGFSGAWLSGITSRVSSHSTAPSSILSSSDPSEDCRPTSSGCSHEASSESFPSPTPAMETPPVVEESGNTPGHEDRRAAFDPSSAESASKARVNAWTQDVASQSANDDGTSQWEKILTVAAESSPKP